MTMLYHTIDTNDVIHLRIFTHAQAASFKKTLFCEISRFYTETI